MSKLIETAIVVVVGLVVAALFFISRVASWFAALAAGLLFFLAFLNLLGWWAAHQIANWQAFVQMSGQAALYAAVVFTCRFLPVLLIGNPTPGPAPRHDPGFDLRG